MLVAKPITHLVPWNCKKCSAVCNAKLILVALGREVLRGYIVPSQQFFLGMQIDVGTPPPPFKKSQILSSKLIKRQKDDCLRDFRDEIDKIFLT